jgi:hypothetical protein
MPSRTIQGCGLGVVFSSLLEEVNNVASELYLTHHKQPAIDDKGVLDVLSRGLATEFRNPSRIGCPSTAILEGIALHKITLSESAQWLDHLGSCSPCFIEFTGIRKRLQFQRQLKGGSVLVILMAVLGLWLGLHSQLEPLASTLDLRDYSVERGHQRPANHSRLELSRRTKHLILYLPIGSKEGSYEFALLKQTGDELVITSGIAQLKNHVVILQADLDLSRVPPDSYFLGIRQPGLEWARFLVRVF